MSDNFVGLSGVSRRGLKPDWVIGVGVVLIILGILAWTDVVLTTLASVMVLGVLVILAGIAQLLQVSAHRVPGERFGSGQIFASVLGILYIVAGFLMIEEPATGSVFLTALLAGCLIFVGLSRAVWAAGHRGAGTWWMAALSGALTLLIGVLIYASLPWSGLTLFGTLIAIELIIAGVSAVAFGLSLRRLPR